MDNDTTEQWKDIPGYEGKYQVSDQGRVYNIKRGTLISGWVNSHGYQDVRISSIGNVRKKFKLHRLVMLAFEGECPIEKEVNHKNGIKTDNRLVNLEYCTQAENHFHAVHVLGAMKPPPAPPPPKPQKLDASDVVLIRKLFADGANKKSLARLFGVTRHTVRSIIQRKIWKHVE